MSGLNSIELQNGLRLRKGDTITFTVEAEVSEIQEGVDGQIWIRTRKPLTVIRPADVISVHLPKSSS